MSQEINLIFLFTLLALAIGALFGGISRWTLRSYYLSMADLSKHFSGSCSNYRFILPQPQFIGLFSGYKFSATYVTGNKGLSVNGLSLVCYFTSSSKLKMFVYDKNPGPVLFAKRIYTAGNDLDKYHIFSNNPEEAQRYLNVPARSNSINQIIGKWQMLKISGRSIYTYADIRTAPSLDPEILRTTINNLIELRIDYI